MPEPTEPTTRPLDGSWHVEMLGGLRACRGDHVIARFRTRKAALLLARLALRPGRDYAREELAETLWPDADGDAARASLRQSLAILRRHLEPPGTPAGMVLVADRTVVRLNPQAVTTDVGQLEAALAGAARAKGDPARRAECLARALALYRGELLPGVYEDWALDERARLEGALDEARAALADLPTPGVPPADSPAPPEPPPTALRRLPLPWTRFFGRETELCELSALLRAPDVRLVTLSGPGGSGKTRLAVEAARQAAPGRRGPVCFVPLADLRDPALIPTAVLGGLGLTRAADTGPLDQIVAALAGEPDALLVLDNLEQFAEAAAPFVLALLSRLPALTILASSRQRLFLAGEREFPVAPLPIPEEEAGTPERLLTIPSVGLFADRARAACPDFAITPRNAGAVAALCRRLEGIPLALELAASWAQALSPAQMLSRLEARSALPARRTKGVPDRHQTLWAAVAWSCDLLPPDLRRFWTRLSAFRGGWTTEAAEDVCQEPEALSLLTQLRARSLVQAEDAGDGMRWRMLETLRGFAEEQLTPSQREALAGRHADHFRRRAQAAEPHLDGPAAAAWLDGLEADHDNLRAALTWHLGPQSEAGHALQMACDLWWFWRCHIHLGEGRAFLEAALAREAGTDSAATRADAFNGAGVLARLQRDYGAARRFGEEALRLRRQEGDPTRLCPSLNNLGNLRAEMGDYAESQAYHLECLRLYEESGRQDGITLALNNLTNTMIRLENYEAAAEYNARGLALSRECTDAALVSSAIQHRALIERHQGRLASALHSQRECLRHTLAAGDRGRLCDNLAECAALLCLLNREKQGVWLYASLSACRAATGLSPQAESAAEAAGHLAAARSALGNEEYERLWVSGERTPLEEAVASALADAPTP